MPKMILMDRQNATQENGPPMATLTPPINNNHQNEDGEQTIEKKFELPLAPAEYGTRFITFNYLLDFAIQFTYHEFSILTELLQKKSESDRKISLAHFARSTRMMFLKIYAIVKWVKKSKKFEQLDNICYFLEQQAGYFVDTADRLFSVARSELIFAGLPVFQINKAADILSRGTYSNIPLAIKKRYISERPLTRRQTSLTLKWLNNSLRYRLIQEASNLPAGIKNVQIKNGMAIFTAPNEFVLKMTIFPVQSILPTDPDPANVENWKWTVLDLEILVVEYEIGCGSSLMHPAQKQPLIALCQAQICQEQRDIENIYKILHDFCIKLQLDLLFCQVDYLTTTVSPSYIQTKRYDPRRGTLHVLYWTKNRKSTNYSIKIEKSKVNLCSGLKLHHYPYNPNLPIFNDNMTPNFHQIFNQTIQIRCQEVLERTQRIFSTSISCSSIRMLQENQHLIYQLVPSADILWEETLQIYVNTFSGDIECRIGLFETNDNENLTELERQLNNDSHLNVNSIKKCIQKLQIQLLIRRYEDSLDENRMRSIEVRKFPIQDGLKGISDDLLCIQSILEPRFYLIVEFVASVDLEVQIQFSLFDFTGETFKVTQMNGDEFASIVYSNDSLLIYDRVKIQQIFSCLFDRIVWDQMIKEFAKHGIRVNKLEDESGLKLNSFYSVLDSGCDVSLDTSIECYIRRISPEPKGLTNTSNETYVWSFECVLKAVSSDIYSEFCMNKYRTQGHAKELTFTHHKNHSTAIQIVTQVIDNIKGYTNLYNVFRDFAVAYENYFNKRDCRISECTYENLKIEYGESLNNVMSVSYKPKDQKFALNFYHTVQSELANPHFKTSSTTHRNAHALFQQSINEWFNRDQDLSAILNYLLNTNSSCAGFYNFSHCRLRSLKPYSLMMGLSDKNFPVEICPFIRVASPTQLRIIYGIVHMEFNLLMGNMTALDSFVVLNKKKHSFESVPFFYDFWHFHSKGNVGVIQKNSNSFDKSETLFKTEPSYFDSISPLTPHSGNNSVNTPTKSQESTSSPLIGQQGTPPKQEGNSSPPQKALMLDANALENAMMSKSAKDFFSSSLDEYLHSVNFLHSVGTSLNQMYHMAMAKANETDKKTQFPLSDIRFGPDFVEMHAVGLANSMLNVDPWHIRIYIYLCNQTFSIRCNLTFSGVYVPDLRHVQIFERYFESRVVQQYNEMEILSFVTACRVMADGVFSAIAQIMELEMSFKRKEMGTIPYWKLNLLLCVLNPVTPSDKVNIQAPTRRCIAGLIMNESCKHLLITLSIRLVPPKRGQKTLSKRVELVYTLASNTVSIRNIYSGNHASETDKKTFEAIVNEANKVETTECRIWSAIQHLLKYRP